MTNTQISEVVDFAIEEALEGGVSKLDVLRVVLQTVKNRAEEGDIAALLADDLASFCGGQYVRPAGD